MPERGAQEGNKNALKNRPYADALRRVLAQLEVKDDKGNVIVPAGEALRAIVEAQVRAAIMGDIAAQKEVADRSDGKPAQQIQLQGDEDHPLVSKIVREVIVPPK